MTIQRPTPSALAASTGLSISYCSEILNGIKRPTRETAIAIYEKTGIRFPPISALTNREVKQLKMLLEMTE